MFSWKGINIIPQIGHIVMTLNIGWVAWTAFNVKNYRPAAIGLLLGIAVFSIFIWFQQNYAASHRRDFERIMGIITLRER